MLTIAGRIDIGAVAQQEFKRVNTSTKDFFDTVSNVTYH